ncbi:hypothetical protein EHQ12_02975 [Leptospira gomenensis]|uniref:Glycosyltransferase RgtA/B/C/D-like domain-containing protein n=1 Tax=Leptospira gomenensis TaxID=2484974 RepID=A0A5F1Y7T7_9LEPT|nr:hypothetical protein [Leptospira gomenensis]TGK31024.1 hypothetical protein EHQ17_15010 [Leptospira gomenensis]TGK43229.1 hypothetical protein EHQ12_02975 [Leptospira gomenensis]TGK45256.1 hypothetical protein EHQ07_09990 [Leptospira gomenensis]TGK66171.1 hypothetical protein EHQ13_03725 [Leptospira gomenensis]
MQKLFQNPTFQKSVSILLRVLAVSLVLLFVWKRARWDGGVAPLIQTDAQIKTYQTAQYAANGLSDHRCYYAGREFDPEFRYFPFHYPWVVYTEETRSENTCRFQYPSFFSQMFAPLYRWTGYRFLNSAILLFYFLAAFLTYRIATTSLGLSKNLGIVVFILALTGYPQNSGFEYSETVISNVCFLFFLDRTLNLLGEKTDEVVWVSLFCGIVGSLAVFLRSESVFYYSSLGIGTLVFSKRSFPVLLKKFRFLVIGFLVGGFVFSFSNYIEFGAILGIRSKLSYSDFLKLNWSVKLELLKGYFWGSSIQVGLLEYCIPMLAAVFAFPIWKKRETTAMYFLLLFTAISGMAFVQAFSPYNPGGLYAGLRFTEITYYCLILLAGAILRSIVPETKKPIPYLLYILCILQIFFSLYHTRKNLQVVDFVKKHHDLLQKEWASYPEYPVVHKSLFDMFLVSTSYLDKPHFVAKDETVWKELEAVLAEKQVPGIQVFYFGTTPPKDINAPQDFYEEWIDTKYPIRSGRYSLEEKKIVEGFVLERYVLNPKTNGEKKKSTTLK